MVPEAKKERIFATGITVARKRTVREEKRDKTKVEQEKIKPSLNRGLYYFTHPCWFPFFVLLNSF